MISLTATLTRLVGDAFAAEGLARELGLVQISDRPDLAPFQCNGALVAGKVAKINPRALAEKIAARLSADPTVSKVEIAGPGFLNLDVADEILARGLGDLARDARLGAPDTGAGKTVVIDFGGPNVAKPMHVGHLRSSIIGDCLQRLYRANGWTVVSDVHLGDWGLQMGQMISEVELEGRAPIYFDPNIAGPYPDEAPVTMEELEMLYPRASAACKADPARLEAARRATADLQAGRTGYRALWRHFVKVSEEGLSREFASLGVTFDLWKGESSVDALIPPMIEDLKARGLARESEGALVVEVAREDDKKPLPPLILVKSEGGVLYGTTDLATIVERVRAQNPALILYVVDHRQHGHFEQVFRAAQLAGFAGQAELEHVGYGTMNGPDGRPFKTRAGGVMKLHDLIAMATAEAEKRLVEQGIGADYSVAERTEIARKVGIATIKFADLSHQRTTDYIFDLERFSTFEGKTGPYLQYAAVRIQSILRKAGNPVHGINTILHSSEERALALQLLALTDVLAVAEDKRAPHMLCDYAFELAQRFNRFYTAHHILSESDEGLKAARLSLCGLVLAVLTKVLDLLGIEVPARM
ncbi:MAG: arginine--tRNA ligase [Alphaproteobacteria bacterium]|nr:arginine--tRNA ligase [Alphaproteobacteria bacterium]